MPRLTDHFRAQMILPSLWAAWTLDKHTTPGKALSSSSQELKLAGLQGRMCYHLLYILQNCRRWWRTEAQATQEDRRPKSHLQATLWEQLRVFCVSSASSAPPPSMLDVCTTQIQNAMWAGGVQVRRHALGTGELSSQGLLSFSRCAEDLDDTRGEHSQSMERLDAKEQNNTGCPIC